MASAPEITVSDDQLKQSSSKRLAFQPLFNVKEPRKTLRRKGRQTERSSFVAGAMAAGLQMVAAAPAAIETISKRRKWQVRLTMLIYSLTFVAGLGFLGVAAYEQLAGDASTGTTATIAGISTALLLGLLIVRPSKGIERASLNDTAMLLLTTNYSARIAYAFMEENPGRADVRLEDIERDAFEQIQSTLRMYERLEDSSDNLLEKSIKTSRSGATKKKAGAKKTPAKKTPAKKTPTKKTPGRLGPAKKSRSKRTPVKSPGKKFTVRRTPAKKTPTDGAAR